MSANAQRTRSGHEKFNAGRMDSLLNDLAPDCTWVTPDGSLYPGTFTGPKEVLHRLFMPLAARLAVTVTGQRYCDDGDSVIVVGHYDLQDRASGRRLQVPMVELTWWRDGKLHRHEAFFDTALVRDLITEFAR